MNKSVCFSADDLKRYMLGSLPEPTCDAVALHVDQCVDCEATIAQLDIESDTLIESLRTPVIPIEPVSAYRLAAKRAVANWKYNSEQLSASDNSAEPASGLLRLRDYELLEPLARGGMGTVYRARHSKLNRLVALKVLPSRLLQNPAVVARFEREMQAVGSLRHAAIVQATDGGEAEGIHFLVMELIDGVDGSGLVQLLGILPVADACEIARQAAIGMSYVHEQGIIHRDLKPSNLMVTGAGEVKVLDLGLARVVGEQLAGDELTTVGQLMGTLDFMAPEQLENSHAADERSDIYSLGATLFKLLTGRSPHATDPRDSVLSKLRRISSDPAQPLAGCRADVPAALCKLVDSMLNVQRTDRPESMDAVASSLAAFCESSCLAQRVREAAKLQKQRTASEPHFSAARDANGLPLPVVASAEIAPPRGRYLGWLMAAVLFLAVTAMGIVITLQTTAGQLVIETSSPDVEVRILKAGQPYKQLAVKQQAGSLRLGAGEYEIEIVSDATGLDIENGHYTLKRGETWLAKIVQRELNPSESAPPLVTQGAAPTVAGLPTYEGRNLDEWIALLLQERSPKQLYEACRALSQLANGPDEARAVSALLEAVQYHSSRASYTSPGNTRSVRLWDTVQGILYGRNQSIVLDELAAKLDRDRQAHGEFVLSYLARWAQPPFTHAALLAHIAGLTNSPATEIRSEALNVLARLAPPATVTKHLVAALHDKDVGVQLLAVAQLSQMRSNLPLVVSTLRQLLRSESLAHRAEAAWRLGDLGYDAKAALADLVAIVEDENESVSRDAAYRLPTDVASTTSLGYVSLKDSAIRALAEIGDESVVPALLVEWEFRAFGETRVPGVAPRWNNSDSSPRQANTYHQKWVTDAIQQLIGMHPNATSRGQPSTIFWSVGDHGLTDIYGFAFHDSRVMFDEDTFRSAVALMPRANKQELLQIRGLISAARNPGPSPKWLEFEIKLIDLLATVDDPLLVLPALFERCRWFHNEIARENSSTDNAAYTLAMSAYQDCAVQLVTAIDDWQHTLVEPLYEMAKLEKTWPASLVLLELLNDINEKQQLRTVVYLFQLFSNKGLVVSTKETLDAWLADEAHRAAIRQVLGQEQGSGWVSLIVGMLQSDLADEDAVQVMMRRFGEDSINRDHLLVRLTIAMGIKPELALVFIELLKHPALDEIAQTIGNSEKRVQVPHRVRLLNQVKKVPGDLRPQFTPMLKQLAESAQTSEAKAAQEILDEWK